MSDYEKCALFIAGLFVAMIAVCMVIDIVKSWVEVKVLKQERDRYKRENLKLRREVRYLRHINTVMGICSDFIK